jgi:hypothetical protein
VQVEVGAPKSLASGGVEPRHVIEVRREQLENALSPIEVTLLGIVIDVRASQE